MSRARLTPAQVAEHIRASRNTDKPRKIADGNSLYLMTRRGRGFWIYQYRDGATIRSKGLGSAADVTPAKARQAREAEAVKRRDGSQLQPKKARVRRTGVTFGDVVLGFKDRRDLDDLPGYIATQTP
jgi:hypothetical protein